MNLFCLTLNIYLVSHLVHGSPLQSPTVSILETPHDTMYPPGSATTATTTTSSSRHYDGEDFIFEVTTSVYSINFLCNATYPVTWSLDPTKYNIQSLWNARVGTRRTARDVFDHTTFNYTSLLSLYGDMNRMTGRYFCRSTRNPALSTSIYIYWPGLVPQFLVLAQENITIPLQRINFNKIVLPCYVSSPQAVPTLYKYYPEDKIELHTNNSIFYNPTIGFTLLNLTNPSGTYKCVVTSSNMEIDYVLINVPEKPGTIHLPPTVPTTPPPHGNLTHDNSTHAPPTVLTTTKPTEKPKSNPTLFYDSAKKEMVCCSGTNKSPMLYNFYCSHPATCTFGLQTYHNRLYFDGLGRRTRKNGCATYKLSYHNNGMIVCTGEDQDFELYQNYIIPFTAFNNQINGHLMGLPKNKTAVTVWFSWSEINPEEMMIVNLGHGGYNYGRYGGGPDIIPENGKDKEIFEGQTVTVSCKISPYYFSSGIRWIIKFKNETIQVVNVTMAENSWNSDLDVINPHEQNTYNSISFMAVEQLDSITCMGPVWNSSYWVNKAIRISVNKSIPTTIANITDVNPTWYMNETQKVISCNITGSPIPEIYWMKDNDTIQNSTNVEIVQKLLNTTYDSVESILTIHRVSHSTKGVYSCHATNFGGSESQSIKVDVLEQSSWKFQITIIMGVFITLLLLLATGVFAWKLKQGQFAIQNMQQPNVQHRQSHDDGVTEYNRGYDPSSLNGDLLK